MDRRKIMDLNGIVTQPEWRKRECPFCHKESGWLERLKQRTKKEYICKKCGRKINEKFIIR